MSLYPTFDIFSSDSTETKKARRLSYQYDPLALSVHLRRTGKYSEQIYDELMLVETTHDIPIGAVAEAELIRRYFRNRILMRRLKSEYVSKFMLAVEEIISSKEHTYPEDYVRILVTLPGFYNEGIATEKLYQEYNSLPEISTSDIHDEFKFVSAIERNARSSSFTTYYFANSKNNLLGIRVVKGDSVAAPAWDYIIKSNPKIVFEGRSADRPYRGYDFIFHQLAPGFSLHEPR